MIVHRATLPSHMAGPKRTTHALHIAATLANLLFAATSSRAQVQPTRPLPEPQLRELAGRLLHDKGKAGCKPPNCRILVVDLTLASGETSRLGVQLGDQIANELTSLLDASQIIDRAQLHSYLDKAQIPADLLNSDDALRWLGKELGATTVLAGTTANQDDKLLLTARLLSAHPKGAGRKEDVTVSYNGYLTADLIPIAPVSKHIRLPDPVPPAGVLVAGKHGVTAPRCRYCPAPEFSTAARSAKFQGIVILSVVITAEGQVASAIPLRGAPFGLNESAVAAVQKWQLYPATNEGQPVSAMTTIEVTFHMY